MSSISETAKKRIDWIDTAKGICILLVVLNHIIFYSGLKNNCPSFIYNFFDAFRMPLYFFLSGLFFKTYGAFKNFIKKKINKLLIPFAFFYVISCVIWMILKSSLSVRPAFISYLVDFYYYHCSMVNGPLWFLLCLFEINVLFYALFIVCKNEKSLCVFAVLFGFIGMMFSLFHIQLPMTLATSFTCLPFFCFGYYMKEHTQILYESIIDNYLLSIALACGLFCMLLSGSVLYVENSFRGISYFTAHFCGIMGTMMVILISKKIGSIPLISYVGRYSIVVLCTHMIIIDLIISIIGKHPLSYHFIWVFIVVITLELIIIPIMIKYLPHVTAQKDLLK